MGNSNSYGTRGMETFNPRQIQLKEDLTEVLKRDVGMLCWRVPETISQIAAELDPSEGSHTPLEAARINRRRCRSWDTRSARHDGGLSAFRLRQEVRDWAV